MGLLVAFLAIIAWYLSSLAIEHRVIPKTMDYIFNFLTVSFASFFGALSAFIFNIRKDKEKENLEKVRALNSALFISARQINTIAQLKLDILPFLNKTDAPFNFPPKSISKDELLRIDFSKLEFLIENDGAQLLQKLALEEDRYLAATETVNIRAKFHYEQLQPALEKSELIINTEASENQIRQELGDRIFFTSINIFRDLTEHVLKTYDTYNPVHKELFSKAKQLYPDNTFIYMEVNV